MQTFALGRFQPCQYAVPTVPADAEEIIGFLHAFVILAAPSASFCAATLCSQQTSNKFYPHCMACGSYENLSMIYSYLS